MKEIQRFYGYFKYKISKNNNINNENVLDS